MTAKLLSLDESANRLRLEPSDVVAMIRSGRLHGLQVDGLWLVRAADVEALATDQTAAEAKVLIDRYRAQKDDARSLLRAGDLLARYGTLPEAIECYDRVAELLAGGAAHVKVIAVSKQIVRLIDERVPELATQYRHVWLRLAEQYECVGLRAEADAARRRYNDLA